MNFSIQSKYNNLLEKKNIFENALWKMGTILSWPQCIEIYHESSSVYLMACVMDRAKT